jgi:hypothetical protein
MIDDIYELKVLPRFHELYHPMGLLLGNCTFLIAQFEETFLACKFDKCHHQSEVIEFIHNRLITYSSSNPLKVGQ